MHYVHILICGEANVSLPHKLKHTHMPGTLWGWRSHYTMVYVDLLAGFTMTNNCILSIVHSSVSTQEQYFMHLTNYSVNKHNESFDCDEREDRGSKRTLRSFLGWLRKNGHNVVELWAKIYVSATSPYYDMALVV